MIILLAVIFLTAIVYMAVFFPDHDSKSEKYHLYFLTENNVNSIFEYEKRYIPSTTEIGLIHELLRQLFAGPNTSSLLNPFPPGLKVNSLNLTDTKLIINLSSEYSSLSNYEMSLADYCIIRSLTGINGLTSFSFRISNSPHPISSTDFVSLSSFISSSEFYMKNEHVFILYYPDENLKALFPQSLSVVLFADQDPIEYIVKLLLEGQSNENGSIRYFPSGTSLNSISTYNGEVSLCLSSQITQLDTIKDSASAEVSIYSIVNSLTALPQINSVKLQVEGIEKFRFIKIELSEALYKNNSLIRGNSLAQ